MSANTIADAIIDKEEHLVLGVSKEMMRAKDLGDLEALIHRAVETGKIGRMVGRVSLIFPEYDHDPREVFEDAICRDWLVALEQAFPYVCVILEPAKTLHLLMLSQIPWKKHGTKILPANDEAMQFLLDRGMTAYRFARWQDLDAKPFARIFLTGAGLGDAATAELLDQYESVFEQQE